MCYHYSLSVSSEDLIQRYSAFEEDYKLISEVYEEPYHHAGGFDHPSMPVIVPGAVKLFRWGLIPSWTRTAEEAKELSNRTLNARSETAFEKPSFRDAIAKRRCLVPATGFFEWRTVGTKKYPYYITVKAQPVFSMAGIYDEWLDVSTGELVRSFSILTTAANPLMEKIHNPKKRMPVIFDTVAEKNWLRKDLTAAEVLALCKAYDDDAMEAYTIGKQISAAGKESNQPAVKNPHVYPELDVEQGTLFD